MGKNGDTIRTAQLKRDIQHVWLGKFPGCAGWSSAAQAGLAFLGVSINLARILSTGGLADTAILLFLMAYSRRKMDPRYYGYLWFRGTISLCATVPSQSQASQFWFGSQVDSTGLSRPPCFQLSSPSTTPECSWSRSIGNGLSDQKLVCDTTSQDERRFVIIMCGKSLWL